jgi:hypothetical protein
LPQTVIVQLTAIFPTCPLTMYFFESSAVDAQIRERGTPEQPRKIPSQCLFSMFHNFKVRSADAVTRSGLPASSKLIGPRWSQRRTSEHSSANPDHVRTIPDLCDVNRTFL